MNKQFKTYQVKVYSSRKRTLLIYPEIKGQCKIVEDHRLSKSGRRIVKTYSAVLDEIRVGDNKNNFTDQEAKEAAEKKLDWRKRTTHDARLKFIVEVVTKS